MVNVNELEKQCNEIKTKLNNHGSAVKDIVKEFSEFDHDYSEEDYNNVKSLIKNSIDELTKEKGRLSNLNNDASNLASSLMTTEKELNDKMDKLREMSDYYWDKLYAARKEGEEAERELNSMNSKMAEAEKMYRDAVEERNRRREFTPWTLVKILIPPLFIGMLVAELEDLINDKEGEIRQLKTNMEYYRTKRNNLQETRNKLESEHKYYDSRRDDKRDEIRVINKDYEKAEKLRSNTVKMEQEIVQWTAVLQELNEKIQKVHKHRGMISAGMFGRQKAAIKNEIEQIITDAREIYTNKRFAIKFD